jgi:glycosyltransferase involved in cell wall biosynthesis
VLFTPAARYDDALVAGATGDRPKVLMLVTEDWFFWSHRLAAARAARDAGFEVVVATRVREHGERIRAEGFGLRPLTWRRRGDGLLGGMRALLAIARLYRAERPDLVHHIALKAIVFGALALRLAFPFGRGAPPRIAAVMGLGIVLGRTSEVGWRAQLLTLVLRLAARKGLVTVENRDDQATLMGLGIDPAAITQVGGSGVNTNHYAALPESPGDEIAVALVARMLRSKGVLDAAAAVRRLRERGCPIRLLLAGAGDPDNRDTLGDDELRVLEAEPGITWLGRVADVREVWREAAIAVLPSTYGEGLPSALLEAAACARPIVTTDMPGCRAAIRHGETGLLVSPHDVEGLAAALGALAGDPKRRQAMGNAGRTLVEREFSETAVAEQTIALYRTALRERSAMAR